MEPPPSSSPSLEGRSVVKNRERTSPESVHRVLISTSRVSSPLPIVSEEVGSWRLVHQATKNRAIFVVCRRGIPSGELRIINQRKQQQQQKTTAYLSATMLCYQFSLSLLSFSGSLNVTVYVIGCCCTIIAAVVVLFCSVVPLM